MPESLRGRRAPAGAAWVLSSSAPSSCSAKRAEMTSWKLHSCVFSVISPTHTKQSGRPAAVLFPSSSQLLGQGSFWAQNPFFFCVFFFSPLGSLTAGCPPVAIAPSQWRMLGCPSSARARIFWPLCSRPSCRGTLPSNCGELVTPSGTGAASQPRTKHPPGTPCALPAPNLPSEQPLCIQDGGEIREHLPKRSDEKRRRLLSAGSPSDLTSGPRGFPFPRLSASKPCGLMSATRIREKRSATMLAWLFSAPAHLLRGHVLVPRHPTLFSSLP